MGTAVLSGVLDSRRQSSSAQNSLASSAASLDDNEPPQLPTSYIATVSRAESQKRLNKLFEANGHHDVEVQSGKSANADAIRRADIVLLACKPQMLLEILRDSEVQAVLKDQLLVSICAGVRIEQIRGIVPASTKVLRAMPNTPSKVGVRADMA